MSVSAINGFNAGDAASTGDMPTKVLSQDDFLKLLVAQMIQFSTLQGNNSMQTALSSLQSNQSLLQANSLLGRQVTLDAGDGVTAQGVVSGVDVSSGTAQ